MAAVIAPEGLALRKAGFGWTRLPTWQMGGREARWMKLLSGLAGHDQRIAAIFPTYADSEDFAVAPTRGRRPFRSSYDLGGGFSVVEANGPVGGKPAYCECLREISRTVRDFYLSYRVEKPSGEEGSVLLTRFSYGFAGVDGERENVTFEPGKTAYSRNVREGEGFDNYDTLTIVVDADGGVSGEKCQGATVDELFLSEMPWDILRFPIADLEAERAIMALYSTFMEKPRKMPLSLAEYLKTMIN